jgi:WD40 repeat protein
LDGADLTGADLREADLSQARLIGADLRAARLAGAHLDRTVLVGADLDPGGLTRAASTFGTALPSSPAQVQLGSTSSISAVAAIHGGDILPSGHADGTVRLWDPGTGKLLAPWWRQTRGGRCCSRTAAINCTASPLACGG